MFTSNLIKHVKACAKFCSSSKCLSCPAFILFGEPAEFQKPLDAGYWDYFCTRCSFVAMSPNISTASLSLLITPLLRASSPTKMKRPTESKCKTAWGLVKGQHYHSESLQIFKSTWAPHTFLHTESSAMVYSWSLNILSLVEKTQQNLYS